MAQLVCVIDPDSPHAWTLCMFPPRTLSDWASTGLVPVLGFALAEGASDEIVHPIDPCNPSGNLLPLPT